ncbi:MAG: ArsB/NhaD family transporter [Candidatus Omnitrophica bacterium]|nr:ArsB/NhaD family transporter [Candidatus Omnitrophota bacterium]
MLASIIIFLVVYFFIATEKLDKTVAVIIGATLMIGMRLISFGQAAEAIDWNVIFLLVGMMLSVSILAKTGFFEWVAITVAKKFSSNPFKMLLAFIVVTAVLSAFLDNVTTIILLAPVTILIAQLLEISPLPFLILEVISSNIGGAATLIGDPPNIIIGSQANLSFNAFLFNLMPCVVIIMVVFLLTVYFLFRFYWNIPDRLKSRISGAIPELAIVDRKTMIRALIVLGFIVFGFFIHSAIGIESGLIALFGGVLMAVICKADLEKVFQKVEWGTIFFFIGLFMIVAGLEHNGVIELLASKLMIMAGSNYFLLCAYVLIGSALFSAVFDNVPFVLAMIPLIKNIIVISGIAASGISAEPLWWSLALGACLGGNGTLIGASANVVASKISDKNRYPISFVQFTSYGMPFMIQSVLISLAYVWLRYFAFA